MVKFESVRKILSGEVKDFHSERNTTAVKDTCFYAPQIRKRPRASSSGSRDTGRGEGIYTDKNDESDKPDQGSLNSDRVSQFSFEVKVEKSNSRTVFTSTSQYLENVGKKYKKRHEEYRKSKGAVLMADAIAHESKADHFVHGLVVLKNVVDTAYEMFVLSFGYALPIKYTPWMNRLFVTFLGMIFTEDELIEYKLDLMRIFEVKNLTPLALGTFPRRTGKTTTATKAISAASIHIPNFQGLLVAQNQNASSALGDTVKDSILTFFERKFQREVKFKPENRLNFGIPNIYFRGNYNDGRCVAYFDCIQGQNPKVSFIMSCYIISYRIVSFYLYHLIVILYVIRNLLGLRWDILHHILYLLGKSFLYFLLFCTTTLISHNPP